MKRWKINPLSHIKRGLASLFVCAVALLPLLSMVQLVRVLDGANDPRKATPLPAMQVRAIDKDRAAPELFNEPLVSVTFDDGWESVYTQALPQLNTYGIPTTQYLITNTFSEPNYMSVEQAAEMIRAGHEVDSHTVDHADLTTLTDGELDKELQTSQDSLRQHLSVAVDDFVSPYGKADQRVVDYVAKYYRSHRNTDGDFRAEDFNVNLPQNFNRFNIIGVTVRRNTSVADIQRLVEYTKATNGWLVLNYHQVDDGPSDFGLSAKSLDKQLAYLNKSDVRIVTMGEVLDTIAPTHLPEF